MNCRSFVLVLMVLFVIGFVGCSDSEDSDGTQPNDQIINNQAPDDPLNPPADVTYEKRESDWFFVDSFDSDTASGLRDAKTDEIMQTAIECKLLFPASPPPYPVLLVGHGWAQNAESSLPQAEIYRNQGYASLVWSARGFGSSTELSRLNSSEYEVKDVIRIINWLAEQDFVIQEKRPEKVFENGKLVDFDFNSDGIQEGDDIPGDESKDFVLGMVGGSYGGGIQLLTASFDRRVDAIAPWMTWNNLKESLAPDDCFKIFWSSLLYIGGLAAANTAVDPHLTEWLIAILMTHEPTPSMEAGLGLSSPSTRFDLYSPLDSKNKFQTPTLVVQGIYDLLFDINQGVTNFELIRERTSDVKMYWHPSGHSSAGIAALVNGISGEGEESEEGEDTSAVIETDGVTLKVLNWFDRYLKHEDVDTGSEFEYDIKLDDNEWETKSGSWPLVAKNDYQVYYLYGGQDNSTGALSQDSLSYENTSQKSSVINIPFVNTSMNELFESDKAPEEKDAEDNELTSISYQTAPFVEDTEVTGIPEVALWLSAQSTDITFFIKLYDVAPDGIPALIDLDVTPWRIPKKDGEDNLMPPIDDAIYGSAIFQAFNNAFIEALIDGKDLASKLAGIPQIGIPRIGNLKTEKLNTFDLRGFAHNFKQGHSLRLTICTSQNGYLHSRRPGTGFIWHGEEHRSKLLLPVVK